MSNGNAGRDRPGDKTPPHSMEAEVSVLGAVLLNNDVIDALVPVLKPQCFAAPAHEEIYRAILALHEKNQAADPVTLCEELKRVGRLDAVGGQEYMAHLIDVVPAASNAVHYANIVREKFMGRRLIRAATQVLEKAYEDRHDTSELLDEAERLIFAVAEEMMQTDVMPIKDVLKAAFKQIEQARERDGRITGVTTGYMDLDDLTAGFQNSELIILASRPSMGKTSLGLNIMSRVAIEKGRHPVAFFSLEMTGQQIARNLLCALTRINSHDLRMGRLSESQWETLGEEAGRVYDAPIFVDDTPGIGVMELRAKARQLRRRHHIELLFVDYLQLMSAPRAENRQQEISTISRGLKGLARELGIPVVAVAQLNRAVEAREDHRPRMADLRESGALEQDADVVLLIHRPAYFDSDSVELESEECELVVAKQRNGPTGKIKLTFRKQYMRFEDWSPTSEG